MVRLPASCWSYILRFFPKNPGLLCPQVPLPLWLVTSRWTGDVHQVASATRGGGGELKVTCASIDRCVAAGCDLLDGNQQVDDLKFNL